jgi:hypothetical protein
VSPSCMLAPHLLARGAGVEMGAGRLLRGNSVRRHVPKRQMLLHALARRPGVSASQQSRLSRVASKKEAGEEEQQEATKEAAALEEETAEDSDERIQEQAAQEDLSPRVSASLCFHPSLSPSTPTHPACPPAFLVCLFLQSDSAAADQVLGRPFSTPVATTPITTPRKQGSTWSLWTMENASKVRTLRTWGSRPFDDMQHLNCMTTPRHPIRTCRPLESFSSAQRTSPLRFCFAGRHPVQGPRHPHQPAGAHGLCFGLLR